MSPTIPFFFFEVTPLVWIATDQRIVVQGGIVATHEAAPSVIINVAHIMQLTPTDFKLSAPGVHPEVTGTVIKGAHWLPSVRIRFSNDEELLVAGSMDHFKDAMRGHGISVKPLTTRELMPR